MDITGNMSVRVGTYPIAVDIKELDPDSFGEGLIIETFNSCLDLFNIDHGSYMLVFENRHGNINIIISKNGDVEIPDNLKNNKILFDSRNK